MKKVASFLLALGTALTGCTASGLASVSSPSRTSPTPGPSSTVAGDPSFSGPYAAELAERYAKSHSTFEREALADGKVTDAEQAEMIERLRTCLAGIGMKLVKYTKGGGQEIEILDKSQDPDASNEALESCETSSGSNTVGLIYELTLRNPQNIDLVPKIVACFKKHHLVGPGYDYKRGLPHVPDDKRESQVQQCNDDPLSLAKGQ